MPENEQKYNWGNTNGTEVFEEWVSSKDYEKELEESLSASLDFFWQCAAAVSKEADIPAVKFSYSQSTLREMQFAFHSYPCTVNICMTGADGKVMYLIMINLELNKEGAPERYSVYPHRIHDDHTVEIFYEEDNTWQQVDPAIVSRFTPEGRDEAVYALFRSLEGQGIVPATYMTEEGVEKIISDNAKMLDLYRAMKPNAVIISDDQVVSSLIEGLVPVNPYYQQQIVFQVAEKLILGCVSGLDENNPESAKMVAVYATDSVEKMTDVLKIMWADTEESAKTYPEVWAGDVVSMVPDSEG